MPTRVKRQKKAIAANSFSATPIASFALENLEARQLLSGSHAFGGGGHGHVQSTITASLLPGGTSGTIATELDTLSATTLSGTSVVYLGNSHGIETYSIKVSGTGTQSTYTVDVNGAAVTAPTQSTTTFGALSGTVSAEFDTLATDLGLTTPAGTASVNVSTPSSGSAVYSLELSKSSTRWGGQYLSVDALGNPVGNETVPFEALSSTLQSDLNTVATNAGAVALGSTSTQNVRVETVDGVTLYSTTFNGTGTRTTVTIDEAGAATSLPSSSTTTFATLTTTVSTELQTLATADGYTGTIAGTNSVTVFTEPNGTVIYAVSVPVSKTGSSGNSYTVNITVASDANGNPTVPPTDGGGDGGGCGGFGFGDGGDGGGWDLGGGGGGGSSSSSGFGFGFARRR